MYIHIYFWSVDGRQDAGFSSRCSTHSPFAALSFFLESRVPSWCCKRQRRDLTILCFSPAAILCGLDILSRNCRPLKSFRQASGNKRRAPNTITLRYMPGLTDSSLTACLQSHNIYLSMQLKSSIYRLFFITYYLFYFYCIVVYFFPLTWLIEYSCTYIMYQFVSFCSQ